MNQPHHDVEARKAISKAFYEYVSKSIPGSVIADMQIKRFSVEYTFYSAENPEIRGNSVDIEELQDWGYLPDPSKVW